MTQNHTILTGKLSRKTMAAGSKSEHEAIFIETDDGKTYRLQKGCNPFETSEIDHFVGRTVQVSGYFVGASTTLVVNNPADIIPLSVLKKKKKGPGPA